MPRTIFRLKRNGAMYSYNTTTRKWWQYTQKEVSLADIPPEVIAGTLDAVARQDFIKEIEVDDDGETSEKTS